MVWKANSTQGVLEGCLLFPSLLYFVDFSQSLIPRNFYGPNLVVFCTLRVRTVVNFWNFELSNKFFSNRIISKNGNFNWPPPAAFTWFDTTRLFLWAYLKSNVYINKPQSLHALKTNIRREICQIPTEMLHKVMEKAEKRAHTCITAKEKNLRDIIFYNWIVAISMK